MLKTTVLAASLSFAPLLSAAFAQPQDAPKQAEGPTQRGPGGAGGPGGFGPSAAGQERKLVEQFDADKNERLDAAERKAAREFIKKNPGRGFGPGGPGGGGPGGRGPGGRGGPSLADPLMQSVDANSDKAITSAELLAGVKQLFTSADSEKKDAITSAQLTSALNEIIPPPPGGGPGGAGGPGGPGGPGGGEGGRGRFGPGNFIGPALFAKADANKDEKVALDELTKAAEAAFKEADKDKNEKLDATELNAGITALMPARGPGGGQGGPGGPGGGPGGQRDAAKPGPKVAPSDVKNFPDSSLYEPTILRTLFLEFENKTDWEAELMEFNNSDVEVPATVTVDGKVYPNVGVHTRGASSFGMIPAGYKHSLNLSFDFVDNKQKLYGHKTLNLLNSNGDASLLSSVLYSHIARQYIPAPRANIVKVVINGESWGLYVSVEQFNKDFLTYHFKTDKGARWKVPGSPNGQGGLEYLGDNIAEYKRRYEIKTKDDDASWKKLIELCRVLNNTPAEQLEQAIAPMLDIDATLWFLALDVALINSDGYWTRASDYSIYLGDDGKFRMVPHDMNESFRAGGGPGGPGGGRGGPGGGASGGRGIELDPLVALNDAKKPLRSKLLAVPSLKAKYLSYVRKIAQDSLTWEKLGPIVTQYRTLVEKEVELDTRKLMTTDAFRRATAEDGSLRSFIEQRRTYLLKATEPK